MAGPTATGEPITPTGMPAFVISRHDVFFANPVTQESLAARNRYKVKVC